MENNRWPPLPLAECQETYATLHLWTQIVGKIKLAQTPRVNYWGNVTLHLSARGFTILAMPYQDRAFEMEFDFIDHQLQIRTDDGERRAVALAPRSVADFYQEVMATLQALGMPVEIWPVPVEVGDPIRFDKDHRHTAYDARAVSQHWRILEQTARVLEGFRAGFLGKCSPVHFFWGSFDLSFSRFSGRRALEREGADAMTREAYSHEVISHGFWPGQRPSGPVDRSRSDGIFREPAFYSYAAPEPPGLPEVRLRPRAAFYSPTMKEFILPYEEVRRAASPEAMLMEFLQSTYDTGADLARWDRAALERPGGPEVEHLTNKENDMSPTEKATRFAELHVDESRLQKAEIGPEIGELRYNPRGCRCANEHPVFSLLA
jgi:hypothetical protein